MVIIIDNCLPFHILYKVQLKNLSDKIDKTLSLEKAISADFIFMNIYT